MGRLSSSWWEVLSRFDVVGLMKEHCLAQSWTVEALSKVMGVLYDVPEATAPYPCCCPHNPFKVEILSSERLGVARDPAKEGPAQRPLPLVSGHQTPSFMDIEPLLRMWRSHRAI